MFSHFMNLQIGSVDPLPFLVYCFLIVSVLGFQKFVKHLGSPKRHKEVGGNIINPVITITWWQPLL